MTDTKVAKTCGTAGPGLIPDPNILCDLEPNHEGRHHWEGHDTYGNPQRTEWGSSGPSEALCFAAPPLPFGEGMPVFACILTPGHGGSHEWSGASTVGVPVLVLWNDAQMVVQLGAQPEAGAPSEEVAAPLANADVNFDPDQEARHAFDRTQQLDAREAELAAREAALEAVPDEEEQPPAKATPAKKATAPAAKKATSSTAKK